MKRYHCTVMSEDGNDEEDNHQKFGFSVEANSEKEADIVGRVNFEKMYPEKPIFWIKSTEI